jgi:prepilin-type N-terminal cleavage/methylation domain-containing protein
LSRSGLALRSGFTLPELLIVIAIIVVVAGLAVPLFRILTGARSVEAALNTASAALGVARTSAINEGSPHGVLFYVDPATRNTRGIIFKIGIDPTDETDPLEKYKAWVPSVNYRAGALTPTLVQSDRVIRITRDTVVPTPRPLTDWDVQGWYVAGKPNVKLWESIQNHNSSIGNNPIDSANGNTTGSFNNSFWSLYTPTRISPIDSSAQGGDEFRFPTGTGVQLIVDPSVTGNERYQRVGAILFDAQGRMSFQPITLDGDSPIGRRMGLGGGVLSLNPGFGLVAYDQSTFAAVNGNTEGDAFFTQPFFTSPGAYTLDERNEEDWLDENTVPLLINRFSGTLGRTE